MDKLKVLLKTLLATILTVATLFLAYNIYRLKGIEDLIRYIVIGVIILIMIICDIFILKKKKNKSKKGKCIIKTILIILYSGILVVGGYYINKTYNIVDSITTNTTTYASSLIALKKNKATNISNIGNGAIGMISDEEDTLGYTIPKEIIKENNIKNEIKSYDNYLELIEDLYNEKIEYAFVPSSYASLYYSLDEEKYVDIADETKVIISKEKVEKQEVKNKNLINEPFTILVMGVDSAKENIKGASFNGDALILVTFNPKTMKATMLSIPRDSYVPIACFSGKRKNKITHAAAYGEKCMINTIQGFTGIDIDYYVKINFKGVVKMVDTLGGVEVDVPYSFCEQDSSRHFGSSTIYVKKGLQTLNGEQTLALARNRHTWPKKCGKEWSNYTSNDFVRGQNQQLIIRALLNKIKTIDSVDTLYDLLDTISNSLETNMSTNEILSLYNVAKDMLIKNKNEDAADIVDIQRLYLSGFSAMIYDYSMLNNQGSKLTLYNFVPYQGSINDVVNAMKVNLGQKKSEITKTASFSVNKPYEEKVIGKGSYSGSISLLPDFTGKDISTARSYCASNGIKMNIVYEASSSPSGQVLKQSVHSSLDMTYMNKNTGITFTVADKSATTPTTPDTPTTPVEQEENNNPGTGEENNQGSTSENQNPGEGNNNPTGEGSSSQGENTTPTTPSEEKPADNPTPQSEEPSENNGN